MSVLSDHSAEEIFPRGKQSRHSSRRRRPVLVDILHDVVYEESETSTALPGGFRIRRMEEKTGAKNTKKKLRL